MSNHWRRPRGRGPFSDLEIGALAMALAAIVFLAGRMLLLAVWP